MANMIPIERFFPLVQPFSPGCPNPVAEQMIRLAAVEFCERTRCWRHMTTRRIGAELDDACTGLGSIKILPPYATIFEFEFAYFNGQKLQPTQFSDLEVLNPADRITGQPLYITQTEPNSVMLIPGPDASGSLQLSIFLKPISHDDLSGMAYADPEEDEDLNVLPDFLLIQQGEAIAHGALARILALPGQSYTDPARSEFYRLSFEEKLSHRFATNITGQQRAPHRTKPASTF